MPIHFRCSDCKKRLSIARRKAGTVTICPHCSEFVTVPTESEDGQGANDGVPVDLAEIDDLLNDAASAEPSPDAPAKPARPSRPAPPPSGVLPNVELMATEPIPVPVHIPVPVQVPAPVPYSQQREQQVSADRPGQVVVSLRQAMLLVVLGAILLFVAFVAGYSVGSKDAPSRSHKNLTSTPG